MKIENQICTLEQSQKLHELGVEKHKSFLSYWPNPKVLEGGRVEPDGTYEIMPTDWSRTYASAVKDSAFTVAELGIMIGNKYTISETTNHKEDDKRWICGDVFGIDDGDYDYNICKYGATEAEARANILIHLIENRYVTVDEVNQRLTL